MGPDLEPLPVAADETLRPRRPVPSNQRRLLILLTALLVTVSAVAVERHVRLLTTRGELRTARATAAPRPASPEASSSAVPAAPALDVCTFTLVPRFVPPGWSRDFRTGDGGEGGDPSAIGHWAGGKGKYVNVLRPDNAWLPVQRTPVAGAGDRLSVLGAVAYVEPIHEGLGIGVTVSGTPPCGFALTGYGISAADLRALAESLYAEAPASGHTTGPSQAPDDAERDGVVPALAAAPIDSRSDWSAVVKSEEGQWVLSRPGRTLQEASDACVLGDRAGTFGIDWICTSEYGEVLLVDAGGAILRAYPMPAVPPKWIYVTDGAVYGGAIGDGGLPSSTLFRIDRATLQMEVIVFPHPTEPTPAAYPPQWRRATGAEEERYGELVKTGEAAGLTPVVSAIGPVGVDVDAVARLFGA